MQDRNSKRDDNRSEDEQIPIFSEGMSKIISLTKEESLFLDDAFTVIIDGEQMRGLTTLRGMSGQASVPVSMDLITKVGNAVLFTTDRSNGGKEALVEVDEADLLALREVANSQARFDSIPIGYNLKRKVLALLLENQYAHEVKKQKDFRYWLRALNQIAPRRNYDQTKWIEDIEELNEEKNGT
jgi:hypothetical protein|tara:strand:- start:758 stop:1309 length:552 start_codon:yes stop_codon:yes gene_type:complete